MKLKVKDAFVGKVKLESQNDSVVLDADTPPDVLAKHYETETGKGFIEPVADKPAKPDTK